MLSLLFAHLLVPVLRIEHENLTLQVHDEVKICLFQGFVLSGNARLRIDGRACVGDRLELKRPTALGCVGNRFYFV